MGKKKKKDKVLELTETVLSSSDYINNVMVDDGNVAEIYKFLDYLIKDAENFSYVQQLLESYPSFVNVKKSSTEYLISKIIRKYLQLTLDNTNEFKISHYSKIIDLFINNSNFKVPEDVMEDLKYELKYNLTKINSIDNDDPEKLKRIIFNLEEGINLIDNRGHKKNYDIDEETLNYKYHIKSGFSDEALKEIDEYISIDNDNYLDMTGECVITIDGSLSHFYEDACSIKKLDNGNFLVGVYVVDVDKFVPVGSKLHKEAFFKGENVYVNNTSNKLKNHMLPESLRTTACSFEEGVNRYAVGYLYEFVCHNDKVSLVNFSATRAIVNTKKNLTYSDFTNYLKSTKDNDLSNTASDLYEFIKMFNRSDLDIYHHTDGFIPQHKKMNKHDAGVPSTIVSTLNTLTNYKVAEYFKTNNIPFIYHVCEKSPNAEIIKQIEDKGKDNKLFSDLVDKCNKLYAKPHLSTKPDGFYPMHFSCYTTMTSPGRRYVDLLNSSRVKKYLIDKEEYTYNREADLVFLDGICEYLNGRTDLNNSYVSDFTNKNKVSHNKEEGKKKKDKKDKK